MTAHRRSAPLRAGLAGGVATALLGAGLALGPGAATATADTAPVAGTPATVSADALPTVQLNGVVWAQVTVGNTVYATGAFTRARPAGAKAGVSETARANLIAYDIRTGVMTSFNHTLNAQGRAITASPDGKRVYVGGDFTTVDGQTRNRVAAFDTATGALVAGFAPNVSSVVLGLAATNTTVYAGGNFFTVNGVARTRLAAVAATNGATLSWAPKADDNSVTAMVLAPGGTKVVVGGRFSTLSGAAAYGLGSLDATTGAVLPFAVNSTVRNAGKDASITSLKTDGKYVLGTGYVFGAGGNFEGAFAADPADGGKLVWLEDCHGDSYDTFANGSVAYVVSHEHACQTVGGFPQTDPWTYRRATAFTDYATGTVAKNTIAGYTDFSGKPSPTPLTWYPTLAMGTYTGQYQAAWSATGNTDYVALGGEFPSVNGTAQQGLVRFATKAVAPNKVGPVQSASLTPSAVSLSSGSVRLTWTATSDMDNRSLTYKVVRDGNTATPVSTQTVAADHWKLPTLGFTDTGLVPGSTHTYRIVVTDPSGNTVTSASSTATVSSAARSAYAKRVLADGAGSYWRLGEPSGTTSYDQVGYDDLTLGAGTTRGAAGSISSDTDTATAFDGSATASGASSTAVAGPTTFSLEASFKTTSTTGGKLLGFGDRQTGLSPNHDRHIWLSTTGQVSFGTYTGRSNTISSLPGLNDGKWHRVVATLGSTGMALYVDGVRVGTNATTGAQPYTGYWRVGGDTSWSGANFLPGTIDEVAVYPTVLTAEQVTAHNQAATAAAPVNKAPTAAFTATPTDLTVAYDGTGSTDPDGTISNYAWTYGDNTTGTGATASHTYAAAGTYPATLTVTDDNGATATSTRTVTVTAPPPPPNRAPTAAFTATPTDLTVAYDGSGSTDPDGTIRSYAWTYGDDTTGTGATASHTYAAAGTYPATLTVTDDNGATATSTKTVTVTAAAPDPNAAFLAVDRFDRTVTGGLGTADKGGAWAPASTRQSVSGGVATFTLSAAGTQTLAYLAAVSSTAAETAVTLTTDKATDQTLSVSLTGRRVSTNNEYRARIRLQASGAVAVGVTRLAGSATDTLVGGEVTVAGLKYTPGTQLKTRLQVVGTSPTTIRVKVWPAASAEPAAWQVERTDSTAGLQAPGGIGLLVYLSGSATTVPVSLLARDLTVTALD